MAGRYLEMFLPDSRWADQSTLKDETATPEIRGGLQAVLAALDRPWSMARRPQDEVMSLCGTGILVAAALCSIPRHQRRQAFVQTIAQRS